MDALLCLEAGGMTLEVGEHSEQWEHSGADPVVIKPPVNIAVKRYEPTSSQHRSQTLQTYNQVNVLITSSFKVLGPV